MLNRLRGLSGLRTAFACTALTALVACAQPVPAQGGSNGNDRTTGGEQGEAIQTGAMIVSPDGKYALVQRNQTSVLVDLDAGVARELAQQVSRFVFAKNGRFGIAVLGDRTTLASFDLASLAENWHVLPVYESGAGATLVRLSDDDTHLVIGDATRVLVLDPTTGEVRGTASIGSLPSELTFVPGKNRAMVVGATQWLDHKPSTAVVDVDLEVLGAKSITVPNCSAPVAILPDATRAFLSPTFCEEGHASTEKQPWTNPDPVSVIDLAADGAHFLKNLPGFGPVTIDPAAHHVVGYLDMQRIDETMFDDKSKIPSKDGPRYHLMTIDPKTLAFELSAVGNVLPRFALGKDGKSLLVDATVQQFRGEASFKATIDSTGKITASFDMFGKTESLFGVFDIDTRTYSPISGPAASLDRFVQLGDEKRVFTLKMSADGLGGDLYRIDVDAKLSTSLGKNLRDIGLLADGSTLVLRERLPAVQVQAGGTTSWYRREQYCLSLDGITCQRKVEFQDSKPFQSGPTCTDYHDC